MAPRKTALRAVYVHRHGEQCIDHKYDVFSLSLIINQEEWTTISDVRKVDSLSHMCLWLASGPIQPMARHPHPVNTATAVSGPVSIPLQTNIMVSKNDAKRKVRNQRGRLRVRIAGVPFLLDNLTLF